MILFYVRNIMFTSFGIIEDSKRKGRNTFSAKRPASQNIIKRSPNSSRIFDSSYCNDQSQILLKATKQATSRQNKTHRSYSPQTANRKNYQQQTTNNPTKKQIEIRESLRRANKKRSSVYRNHSYSQKSSQQMEPKIQISNFTRQSDKKAYLQVIGDLEGKKCPISNNYGLKAKSKSLEKQEKHNVSNNSQISKESQEFNHKHIQPFGQKVEAIGKASQQKLYVKSNGTIQVIFTNNFYQADNSTKVKVRCTPQKIVFTGNKKPQLEKGCEKQFLHIENVASFIRAKKKMKGMQSRINEMNKPEIAKNINIGPDPRIEEFKTKMQRLYSSRKDGRQVIIEGTKKGKKETINSIQNEIKGWENNSNIQEQVDDIMLK